MDSASNFSGLKSPSKIGKKGGAKNAKANNASQPGFNYNDF